MIIQHKNTKGIKHFIKHKNAACEFENSLSVVILCNIFLLSLRNMNRIFWRMLFGNKTELIKRTDMVNHRHLVHKCNEQSF